MTAKRATAEVIVMSSAEQATDEAAALFKQAISHAVADRRVCNVALAGGTTPHDLYQKLADDVYDCDVPWASVNVFFGDERDVPHDHVDSNYHMAQRALLDHAPIPPEQINPMPADAEDLAAAAAEYEQIIRRIVPGEPIPQFDLILLGMGGDGHTASLFPRTDALSESHKLVVSHHVPVLGRNRMTFTCLLINAARHVMFLITGEDKADAVAAVLGDDKRARKEIPAAQVNPSDGKLTIVLDAAAARKTDLKPATE